MFIKRKHGGRLHKFYWFLWTGPRFIEVRVEQKIESKAPGERLSGPWVWCSNHWDIVADPVLWIMCKFLGHEPVDDQCMRPEHRHCLWCRASQPNKPLR